MVDSVQSLRDITGDNSGATRSGIQRVVAFYEMRGNPEKAAEYQALLEN